MLGVILFLGLLLFSAVSLIFLLVRALLWLLRRGEKGGKGVKRSMLAFGVSLVLLFSLVWLTQWTATTPVIRDAENRPLAGSIAELRCVTLNGREEWISLRGDDRNAPVLLFLAGGPGGTQMAAVRHALPTLERHFVVVHWDQPGSGKSYGAVKRENLTAQTYIDDGIALTKLLCDEFGQDSIYLMGESWGSALGIFLVRAEPDLYRAFVGTGQMVAFAETERIDYQLALDMALAEGNDTLTQRLQDNGPPPYYGPDVTWKSAAYLNFLGAKMAGNPAITNGGYHTLRDIFSEEYGLLDKLNFLRGVVDTFGAVYPQLYAFDLREGYTELEVPVYFFLGRHDLNAPLPLAVDYAANLVAPVKQVIWFEHSGHSPWLNEPDKFVQETLQVALLH